MHHRIVFLVFAAALTVPVCIKSRPPRDSPGRAAFVVSSSSRISVQVLGAVKHPGIYEVAAKNMAICAIKMAEPDCRFAGASSAALPVPVIGSGDALTLRCMPDGSANVTVGTIPTADRIVMGIPLDISRMTRADWELLPGIGPALAQRIMTARQINGGVMRVEHLLMVDGISETRYAQLKRYF